MRDHHSDKKLLKRAAKLEKELAARNHELRIEAALEKVRAVAMAMNKPDDLPGVCKTLYKQFLLLGFSEIRNAMINIHNDAGKSFINYDYSDQIGKSTNQLAYSIHPLIKKQVRKIRNANDAFSETYFTGKDLAEWKKFRKRIGEKDDPRLRNSKGLYYYLYSIGIGSIGISTFAAISKEKKAVLKRFRNVFALSYQRYVDIAKAEAQAREAEIEVALERVRARTLAMQKSDELKETTLVLFQQFKSLKATTSQVSICVFDENTKMGEMFVTLKGEKIDRSFPMELDKEVFVMKKAKKAFLDRQKKFSFTVRGKELQNYNHWRNTLIGKKGWDESNAVRKQSWYVNGVFFSRGLMGISSDTPPTPEALKLLDRFASLFDLTFTRFLDLQKAEAQAREAKIEAALERVRARSMAMHQSKELHKVIKEVAEQLILLGFGFDASNITTNLTPAGFYVWNATPATAVPSVYVPYKDIDVINAIYLDWGVHEGIRTATFNKAQKNTFFKHYFKHTDARNIPEERKKYILDAKSFNISSACRKEFALDVINYRDITYTDEQNRILERFAKVFEQSYTRFLDLQKAEAQAREAQIEAALEKIRSTSLAMHHANELEKVVTILFVKLSELGLSFSGAGIFLFDQREKKIQHWIKGLNLTPVENILPYDEEFKRNPIVKDLWSAMEKGEHIFNRTYAKSVKDNFFQYTSKYNDDSRIPAAVKEFILQAENFTLTYAAAGNSLVGLDSWSGPFILEEDLQILGRFAKVFDQAYVRFLDLQKAEAQAREAQIEAALERVRSRTMGMQRSDELQAAAVLLFQQVVSLGVPAFGCGFNIWDEDRKFATAWMAGQDRLQRPFKTSSSEDIFLRIYGAAQHGESLFVEEQEGDALKAHYAYMNSIPVFREIADKMSTVGQSFPTLQIMHCAFFAQGYLMFITYNPVPDAYDIFKRFAKVFEQTYTRFLDLQKAEAQAREAQIEAAMERVRSRTMAMHHTSELQEVIHTVHKELLNLNLSIDGGSFVVINDDVGPELRCWGSGGTANTSEEVRVPHFDMPFCTDLIKGIKKGPGFFTEEFSQQEKKGYFTQLFQHKPWSDLGSKKKKEILSASGGYTRSVAVSKHTSVFIINHHGKRFTEDENGILKRFAKVFEQTYTRFLDLQKAEAQARESQIQLALERVRARTMAMQHSNELGEAASLLFKQISDLGIHTWTSGFNIWQSDGNSFIGYNPTPSGGIAAPYIIPSKEDNFFKKIYQAKEAGEDFIVFEWKEGPLAETYSYMKTLPIVKEVLKDIELSGFQLPTFQINHCVFFAQGFLLFITLESYLEAHDIFKRFGRVFEQTYTRFLDLQKAEAQAKESQIQLALERVRARTMAMQKSDELAETAAILFQQFKGLGQDLMQMTIGIVNEKEGVIEFSVTDWSGSGDRVNQSFNLSIQEPTLISKMYAGWKEQRKSLVVDLTGKELEGWLTYRNAMSGVTIRSQDTSGRRVITSAFFSKGHLSFSTPELPAAEHIQLLERFAGVFDLTYTRFLDLQKAEAQARESQIQLALERVRARTMAMQRSDELSEAASLLFQQVQSLGAPSWTAGYCIWDEDKKAITLWMSSPGGDIQPPFRAPLDENPTFIRYLEADNKGLELYIEEETAKVTEENYQYLLRLPVVGEILNAIMKEGYPLPTYQVDHCAYFSKGFLLFITYQQVPELHDIFKRFAAVFDQTYTRFLDLQKAEAQAREARIEAALEKVRSRTMGMQKSEELKEVIQVVFEQFVHLNILVEHSGFIIDYKEKDDMNIWLADQHEVPFQITIPYFDCAHWNSFIVAKEKGQDFFANHLSFEEKNKFYQDLFKLITGVTDEAMEYYLSCPGLAISTVLLDNVGLYIENFSGIPYSDQENAILMRFGKVFQQTYTRFLDLQQAEAQARESQIQLALERVRARTMAMQKSVELAEAAQVLYEEFRTLHINTFTCGYLFIKENQHKQTAWVTTPDGTIVPDFIDFPLTGDHVLDKRYEDWKQKKPLHVFEIQGEANKEHHRFLASEVPDQIANEIFAQIPDRIIFYCANFSAGYLFIIATEFLSSEEEEIIVRFAKVFELTYTRFSDLKQAETQARESQIQLALERVRASTMAMHRSEDLAETAQILFQQLQELGEMPDRMSIGITDEANGLVNFWSTDQMGSHINNSFKARLDERTVISKTYQAWKENKKSLVIELHGTELQEWIRFARQEMNIAVKDDFIKDRRVHNLAFFSHGWLLVTTHDLQSSETIQILERFASVFNLTYRRFLDLQKAEAQAKEAQIEAALERVRSRSMAMHQSSDLHEVVKVVTEQLSVLGIKFNAANFAKIHSGGSWDLWISAPEQAYPAVVEVPYIDHGLFNNIKEAVEKGRDFLADAYNKEEKNIFFKHFFENTAAKYTPDARKEWVMSCKGFARSVFLTKNIWLAVSNYEGIPFSNEENAIFKRFANAFEQTYTRFLDLQKAEANAREAQIEASLERVRSRSMAMHQSGDLQQVIKVVAEQFVALGLRFDTTNFAKVLADGSWDVWVSTPQQAYPSQIFLPYFEHRIFVEVDEMKASGKDFFAGQYTVEEKNSFFRNFFENTVARDIPQARKEYVYSTEGYVRSVFLLKNILFAVGSYDGVPYSDEENAVFRRFATVFEQAYTRFLDLQRAEAQAREAQIEASLERVRSKTMAMHTSDDVIGATTTLFTELEKLGIENLRCGISIINSNRTMEVWSISNIDGGKTVKGAGSFDMNAHPVWQRLFESWERKEEFQESYLAGKEKEDYVRILNSNPAYLSQPILEFPDLYREAYNFNEGALWTYSLEPHAEEEREVMKRFTSVFSLTFRRYQDLKKAEAQTREAQIEASLERVRAKAMAMHNSQDLAETIKVFYQQLDSLKLMPRRCGVGLITKDPRIAELMGMVINEQGETMEIAAKLILKNHPILENIYDAWIRQEDYYPVLRGNEIKEYYQLIGAQISAQNYPDDAVQFGYFFSFPEGQVYAWAEKEFTEDELKIYHRFTSVLSLTYKRYKDLKQAEAQAKEAQIEAGLERVRARTMAMHTSDDVSAATATMFTELEKLGIENFRGGITNMLPNRTQHVWSVNNLAEGKVVKAVGAFNMDDHPFWQMMYKEWQEKNDFTHYFLAGQEKEDYIKILNSTQGYLARAIENFPDVHFQVYFFNEGGIWTNSLHAHTDEEQQIMKRFTSVFSLTFRRYQDLRKAEAQAREATIEAALEKVRGKAMAMHNSNDLSVTASMVFTELRKLGINPIRCGVGLLNKESRKAQLYSATSAADGDSLSLVGWVILSEHPVLEKIYDTWLKNEEYYPELEGEQMRLYYEQLLKGLPVTAPTIEADKKQYGHFIPFSVGCLYAWSENAYDESEIKILKRFATIIDLTFRRYMELQTSEANAREAVKQAAFDRIRADIASMRKVEDLDRITPLIWNELTILGLPFIRCGIFLMDDSQRLIHTFLSTPDGKAIGAFHLPYDTPIFDEVVDTWRHKKIFLNHWTEPDYIIMADTLMKQGAITDREQYIGSLPAGGFHLHFIPFLQGMLYVGNINKLGAEEMSLIESVADAFSTAYARYEDFNKLEAAKQQVERTLTDLKQAQTQLVQSEKMASLGELTAGIAHEIQNPLNFVNNFSDVSNELLEEMKEELAKGNVNEAIAIAEDVKHNLEKINHHGKRADGIVKGMLQHSRSSSGQKEMTDINALADEYLRLAYHGLRAKDKSFNAKFETSFDDNVGKVNIIQQDIGRVILNLINNAFYAVSEKKKHLLDARLPDGQGYDPTVTLTTIRDNGRIEVKVRDNGNGISQKNLDKIFQPFFTTKPTGQGTGLGLSLAYDIVKAHGGEITVNTNEGEGSEFIVQLPVAQVS